MNVSAPERLPERREKLEDYRNLTPGEEPVEPYFMIFMRPTTGDPYYGWWLYGNNRELLCTSDQFSTIDESKRNLERVRGAVPNAAVYYARE